MDEDLDGMLAHDVIKKIKRDMLQEKEYPQHQLEISVTYDHDSENVRYGINNRDGSSSESIVTQDEVGLNHQDLSLEEVEDLLGGALEDSFEGVTIIVNGQYVQGEPSSEYRDTGEWEQDII